MLSIVGNLDLARPDDEEFENALAGLDELFLHPGSAAGQHGYLLFAQFGSCARVQRPNHLEFFDGAQTLRA